MKLDLLVVPIGVVRRMAKAGLALGHGVARRSQSLNVLGPVTLIVALFTVYTLLSTHDHGEGYQVQDVRVAVKVEQKSGSRPLPKANHMSRKLLIEMVKSKGLWEDTTRRPFVMSLKEKLFQASQHAINRSIHLDKQLALLRKRMKPFEYWKIGGENISLDTKGINQEALAGLSEISRRNQEVLYESLLSTTESPVEEAPSDASGLQIPATTYPLLNDEIVYLVKAAGKFEKRIAAAYKSWGKAAARFIVSTDVYLEQSQIPAWKQRIAHLNQMARRLFRGSHALSCVTTCLNLAKVLQEEELYDTKWLVIVDDDTFVIPENMREYLSRFEYNVPHYMGFSIPEPINWLPRRYNGRQVHIAASSAGLAFSRGLMQVIRHNLVENLQLTAIHERCARGKMGDDVALGLLALDNGAELIPRPDLVGFHWLDRPDPTELTPLSMHLQLQFYPDRISRFAELGTQYINMTATDEHKYGDDFVEKMVRYI